MSSYRIACLIALVICGCQQDPKRDQPAAGSASAATATASAAPATSGSAGSAASAAVGSPDIAALVGTWEGSYDAKKGTVAMPTGHKDKHWSKDEGKTHVGAGTITLRVSPAGDIEGEAKGVLGEQVLSGKAEGNVLRATVSPKEPTDPQGFTGVLVCLNKDGAVKGELKAAGPTADVVRESTIELKKKK